MDIVSVKITCDKEVDALDVTLRSGRVEETVEVTPEVLLDVDKNGKLLHVEVIGTNYFDGRIGYFMLD